MLLRAVLWDGLILLFSIISYIQTSQCAHHSNDRDSVLRRRAIPAAAAAANQSTAYSSNDCTSTTSATTYTLFTPSASARPTPITSQFQVVTSYVSEFVLCPLTSTRSGPSPQIQTAPGTQTFSNTSLIQCSTFYSPTVTPICHSTLIVPGGFPLVVTECEQNITFSTRDGYASVSDSGQKVVTRFVAPWEALTTGVPQGLVEVNVCEDNKESEDGGCATRYESWSVGLNNMLETVTNMVDFSTVINGVRGFFPLFYLPFFRLSVEHDWNANLYD